MRFINTIFKQEITKTWAKNTQKGDMYSRIPISGTLISAIIWVTGTLPEVSIGSADIVALWITETF